MILAPLTRHLAVCSLGDVQRFLDFDPDFWNVISIRDTTRPRLQVRRAKSIQPWYFEDAEVVEPGSGWIVMSADQAVEIWRFVDSTEEGALLVHCVAGLSRSTAVAAAIIARSLVLHGQPLEDVGRETVDRLLQVRPPACPNGHVMLQMLRYSLPDSAAQRIALDIWEDDRIMQNRFVSPH
jgi:predicted protein tyrosine phosphatase